MGYNYGESRRNCQVNECKSSIIGTAGRDNRVAAKMNYSAKFLGN